MRVVVFSVLFRLSVAATTVRPCEHFTGSTYKYMYQAETMNRIVGTSTVTSGIKLTATISLKMSKEKNFVEMMVENAEMTPVLRPPHSKDFPATPPPSSPRPFSELSEHPMGFKMDNGRIVEIYPSMDEKEEILNIKRGIVSAFQVTVTGMDGTRTVEETDVLGTCETVMMEYRDPLEDVFVTKYRDTDTCTKCGLFTILRPHEHQEATFVGGRMNAEYNVSTDGVIRSAFIEQVEKFTPMSADAGTVLTVIMQSLKLTSVVTSDSSYSLCPVQVSMLSLTCATCMPHTENSCQSDVKSLMEMMAASPPHDIPHHFIDLIELMRMCSKPDLDTLKNLYVQPKRVDAKSGTNAAETAKMTMEKHTFFLDALAYVGTEPAMDLIVNLATNNPSVSVSNSRKAELTLSLSFLPVYTTCPCLVLKRALTIAEARPTHMIPKLVMGAVINKVMSLPKDSCKMMIDEAVEFLTTQLTDSLGKLPQNFDLQQADDYYMKFMTVNGMSRKLRYYYDDAMHSVKALGNAGVPETLETLKSAMKDPRLQIEGRAAAIYAMQSMAQRIPEEVRWITMDYYLNTKEEPAIRVAAFLTFMRTMTEYSPMPTMKEMLRLMKSVHNEPDSYMKSYVCTYFMAVKRSEDPSMRTLHDVVSYHMKLSGLVLMCPAADMGYFSSKATRGYVSLADANLPRSLPRDVMGIGFSSGVLMDERSWLPHSVAGKVTANLFGYGMELLEVGGQGTGLQKLITHLFGPTGYLRKGTRDMGPSGLPVSEMKIDMAEDIGLSGYLKVLGQEIGWKHWEKDDLMRRLYDYSKTKLRETITDTIFGRLHFTDISEILDNLVYVFDYLWNGEGTIWHGKQDVTKTARVMDVKRIVPTIIGMPLNLAAKAAAHLQMDVEGEVNYSTKSIPERMKSMVPKPIRNYFFPSTKSDHDEIHAYAYVSPKLSMLSSVSLSLGAYHYEPKLVFMANATSNFTQQIDASLYDNYTLSVKLLDLPDLETLLLNTSYTQFAEVSGSQFTVAIGKYNHTMMYEPIASELLNMTLYSEINYPNSTGVDQAPFFPLSGPANFTLLLQRDDNSSIEMIDFQIRQHPDNSLDEGRYDIELNVVRPQRSDAALSGYAQWKVDKTMEPPMKVVEVDLNSSPSHFSSIFYGNTKKRMAIEGSMSLTTGVSNTEAFLQFNRSHFMGELCRTRHGLETWDMPNATITKPIITIPEFNLSVKGSLANNTDGDTSIVLFTEGSDKPQWLKVKYTTHGLMVNISATSSLFHNASMFSILPYPLRSPICHVFDGCDTHVITFDGREQEYQLKPTCEYILARHRHENNTFAVTRKGKEVMVYINGTTYTLTPEYTMFEVDDVATSLPYKQKHVIQVRRVTKDGHRYIRLSAWAGVDIWYSGGDIQLAVNGFYMNQMAGLCGNANYEPEDDMMVPDMTVAKTEEDMASKWGLSCDTLPMPPARSSSECDTTYSVKTCDLFLSDMLSAAHYHVGVAGFYNACLHDVSCCRSPFCSIRAYLTAAHAKQIDIEACVYGNWSEWSGCDDGSHLQYRERPVLDNPFRKICDKLMESQDCDTMQNRDYAVKDYVILVWGGKRCRSARPVLKCASPCKEIYTESETTVDFRCISQEDPEWKFYNVSPQKIPYKYVLNCECPE